jgi:glucose-1-phosphate thymidylyltransferase
VFVEQRVQDGTAGAVGLARPYVDQPVLIIFVDTIFDADLSVINTTDADGIIWTKEVEDYQRFGVVVTDADGHMTRIVEKPSEPISKRANIGLYYVRNWQLLYEAIDHVLAGPTNKGEYYLTDAFQYMIDRGAKIKVVDVQGWYDAGELGTLLATNRTMLEHGRARRPADLGPRRASSSRVHRGRRDRHRLHGRAQRLALRRHGGRAARSCATRSSARSSRVTNCRLHGSLVGDAVTLDGLTGVANVGDHSVVRAG